MLNTAPLTVTREGSKLFLEGLDQGKNELLAETPTTFFMEGTEFSIKFVADEAGTVTHLVVAAGAQSFNAKKRS